MIGVRFGGPQNISAWESLVIRLVRDQEIASSNLAALTEAEPNLVRDLAVNQVSAGATPAGLPLVSCYGRMVKLADTVDLRSAAFGRESAILSPAICCPVAQQ